MNVTEKIRKLLALASSANESEALSALNKAHELLRQYNMDLSDIEEPEEQMQETIEDEHRRSRWHPRIIHACAKANYCTLVIKQGAKGYWLFGREANRESVKVLYEYLIQTIERNAKLAWIESDGEINKVEYAQGMAERIAKRLYSTLDTECAALVPLQKEAERAAHAALKIKSATHRVTISDSYCLGFFAGANISLNRQVDE